METIKEIEENLEKYDGFSFETGEDTLSERYDSILICLLDAVEEIEDRLDPDFDDPELLDESGVTIWSVRVVKIEEVLPGADWFIEKAEELMWDVLPETDSPFTVCSLGKINRYKVKKKDLLDQYLHQAFSKWMAKSNINFDYWQGEDYVELSYKEAKEIISKEQLKRMEKSER